MLTPVPLYQEVFQQMVELTRKEKLRRTAVQRLALLVTGITAARSCALSRVAAELLELDLTRANQEESIQRRLRRRLTDQRLTAARCYERFLAEVIDWESLRAQKQPALLIVDESSCSDRIHLFRVSLAYWEEPCPWPGHRGSRMSPNPSRRIGTIWTTFWPGSPPWCPRT